MMYMFLTLPHKVIFREVQEQFFFTVSSRVWKLLVEYRKEAVQEDGSVQEENQ